MGRWLVLGLAMVSACTRPNPRSCSDGICSDPAFPFCDVDGALEGEPQACIAVECAPMEFVACRGTTALTCNASGNNYDVTQCETACDVASNGCTTPTTARPLYIAFVSDRDGNSEIYRMNPDGTLPTNLTSNPAQDTSPIWDPTGDRIAFLSDRASAGTTQLYTMNADGSDVVNVSGGEAYQPAWSPDGLHLAFTSKRTGQPEIYKTSRASAAVTPITTLGVAATAQASWSPTGSQIAFASGTIHVINADGTNPTSITPGSLRGDKSPTWDPAGTRIAYIRGISLPDWDVLVINVNGSNPVTVTETVSDTLETSALWSPDSKYIAGEILDGNTGSPTYGSAIYLVDPTGVNFKYCVLPPATKPCWSPDGALLAYESNGEIYAVPRIGGTATRLTSSAASDTACNWRPR